jgi:hypothetical protein
LRNNELKNVVISKTDITIYCDVLFKDKEENEYIALDGIASKLYNKKVVGAFTIYNSDKGYIVLSEGISAHGDSVKKAFKDWFFKQDQTRDISEIITRIKQKGTVNWLDYRLVTGSCESQTLAFLHEKGLSQESEIPIRDAIEITEGRYQSETFKKYFE